MSLPFEYDSCYSCGGSNHSFGSRSPLGLYVEAFDEKSQVDDHIVLRPVRVPGGSEVLLCRFCRKAAGAIYAGAGTYEVKHGITPVARPMPDQQRRRPARRAAERRVQ